MDIIRLIVLVDTPDNSAICGTENRGSGSVAYYMKLEMQVFQLHQQVVPGPAEDKHSLLDVSVDYQRRGISY